MDLKHFLMRHGLTTEDVVRAVRERIQPRHGDVIYLTGSLIEGHGTPRSDIDVYHISEHGFRGDFSFASVIILPLGGISIDIECYARAEVDAKLRTLNALPADQAREPRQAAEVSPATIKFLHNLSIGEAVYGAREFQTLAAGVNKNVLARVLFDRSTALFDSLHVDVMGLLEDDDYRSAHYLLGPLLVRLAAAWSAASGDSNPGEKWLLRKLDAARGRDADLGLPARPSLKPPAEVFGTLDPGCAPDSRAVRRRFDDIVHLSRIVIPWGQRRFLDSRARANKNKRRDAHGDETLAASRARGGPRLPRLRPRVGIRFRQGAYELFDIFGRRAFQLNDLAYEVALHADGRSGADQIVAHLAGMSDADEPSLLQSVHDFESFLRQYELV